MADVRTVLMKQGAGPITVEVEDEWRHKLELEEATEREGGFYAEAHDREANDVQFRFTTPTHEELPITLERRHAREDEWQEIGEVSDAFIG